MEHNRHDPALDVLNKIRGGFWPSDKELESAAAHLGKQERRIEELQAALNPFSKMGAKIEHSIDMPALIDYGNLQITAADLVKAAAVLYGKGLSASLEVEK